MSHKKLRAVFTDPVRANIHWDDVESLVKWLGGSVTYCGGSSVAFELNGVRMLFHSPHPQKEASRGAIRKVRSFLTDAGVEP